MCLINSLKGVSSRYLRAEYTGRINRIRMGSYIWQGCAEVSASRGRLSGSANVTAVNIIWHGTTRK